jgi:uncharacterized protein YlzI (FlbEa/FlbD family)
MDNELYDVEDKPTKSKFFIGERIVSRFISLIHSDGSKNYVRADKIVQMYETSNKTCVLFLDGSDTPCVVNESINEIFAKIRGVY